MHRQRFGEGLPGCVLIPCANVCRADVQQAIREREWVVEGFEQCLAFLIVGFRLRVVAAVVGNPADHPDRVGEVGELHVALQRGQEALPLLQQGRSVRDRSPAE